MQKYEPLSPPYKILILDDHRFIGELLAQRLAADSAMQVVCIANKSETALEVVRRQQIDVALVDVELDGDTRDGIDVAREILTIKPGLRIIGLSAHAECHFPISMLEAGGRGFLSKRSSSSEVIDGVRRVARGDLAVSPDVAHYITVNMKEPTPGNQLKQLTNKEREVLRLLAMGHAIEEAADMLNVSGKTVQAHRASMKKKLEVSTDVDLCLIALKSGIVKLYDSKDPLAESRAL